MNDQRKSELWKLQAGILAPYINKKAGELIVLHQVKIDEHNYVAEDDPVSQAKLRELEKQLQTFRAHVARMQDTLNGQAVHDISSVKDRADREFHRFSAALPMYAYQSEIVEMISRSQVSVLIGETGSGKSTQVCQYLYEHGFVSEGKKIVCTQPRKVAASSLAEHVASEMNTSLGNLVGYQVGLRKHFTKRTKILYSTDHCLLSECLNDPTFSQYSVVVIDEAHERSIHTDLLIGLLKKCLDSRPDLRVVITSATIDPQVFIDYFGGCPLIKVPGRTYPVSVSYSDESKSCLQAPDDYLDIVTQKVELLHRSKPPGDILVFAVTPVDCEKCCEMLNKLDGANCLPLHGQLPMEKYHLVFEQAKPNVRKIVVATNCAETSITISGIKYVVDCGLAKEKQFNAATNVGKLVVGPVTKSSADQRKGRAGRVESGECYRVYTEQEYQSMIENAVPEILRVNLRQALLYLIGLGIKDPLSFEFVQSPSKESLVKSYQVLEQLGAIDVDGGLSQAGQQMVHIPIDPKLSKFVLLCCEQEQGFLGIVIAAMTMQGGMIFYRGRTDEEKIKSDRRKANFIDSQGDVVTAVKVYEEWRQIPDHKRGAWCFNNSVNGKAMKSASTTVKEVHGSLSKACGITVHREISLDQLPNVLGPFITCHFPANLCVYSGNDLAGYFIPELQEYCRIHPSSALVYSGVTPQFAMFESILETRFKFLCFVSVVELDLCDGVLGDWLQQEYNKQMVVSVPLCSAGQKVVDVLYRKRWQIQGLLKETFSSLLLVPELQWSQKKGQTEINMRVREQDCQMVTEFVKTQFVEPVLADLKAEHVDVLVAPRSEVKVTIGNGAVVKTCLMPLEFKSIRIQLKRAFYRRELDVEAVKTLLTAIGEVVMVKPVEREDEFWGFAEFLCPLDAKKATDHDFEKITCRPNTNSRPQKNAQVDHFQGQIHCEWLRMPSKGHAYVNFAEGLLLGEVLDDWTFSLSGHVCTIERSRRNANDLIIKELPENVTEEEIERNGPAILKQRAKMVIPRVQRATDADDDRERFRKLLCEKLEEVQLLPSVLTIQPRGKAVLRGFISLPSLTACLSLSNRLSGVLFEGRLVKCTLKLQYCVSIPANLFEKFQGEISAAAQALSGTVKFRLQKNKRYGFLDISSSDQNSLGIIYESIMNIVNGKNYECNDMVTQLLLSSEHYNTLHDIMDQSGAVIDCDNRLQRLVIYGGDGAKQRAVELLDRRVKELQALKEVETEISLRRPELPTSLLKHVLRNYRVDLAGLPAIPGCLAVRLDIRRRVILYAGSKDGLKSLHKVLTDLAAQIVNGTSDAVSTECPICLCEVDPESVQLTFCGHKYCAECFSGYLENETGGKKFPVTCAADKCEETVYLKDFPSIENDCRLISLAIDHYLAKNSKSLKYCRSADCSNFYRVTTHASRFFCSLCTRSTCTCCHKEAHGEDIACADASDPDGALLRWMAADLQNRKRCPKCKSGIEKNGGCNHMECALCKTHICWRCNAVFDTRNETYNHLGRCGGIF